MKTINLIATVLAAAAMVSCEKYDDRIVAYSQLPDAAQTFVTTYFPSLIVSSVTRDTELFGTTYEVVFTDGTNIDFDDDGQWLDVECRNPKVPDGIVPEKILAHVTTTYPQQSIVDIGYTAAGYDVELTSGLELDFAKDGTFLRIDD